MLLQDLKDAKKREEADSETPESILLSSLQASKMAEEEAEVVVSGTIWDTPEERKYQQSNGNNSAPHKKI